MNYVRNGQVSFTKDIKRSYSGICLGGSTKLWENFIRAATHNKTETANSNNNNNNNVLAALILFNKYF